jgi:hypothetical protein
VKALFSGLAALWCEWTHGGGWIMRDPAGHVNWQCQKCGRWAEPVSERDEELALLADMRKADLPWWEYCAEQEPQKVKCTKCHGTGTEGYRVHGVWPSGEECVEPLRCDACNGFGTVV